MKSAPIIRWPLLAAALTALTGIILSLHLQTRIAGTEADAARLTAETLRLNTEQELNLFSEVLESVCALHALSDAVNQAAMDEFVQKGLVHQHTVLGPFGLTQRINPWLRNEIEGKAKNQPGAYQVVQQGPKGTWIPAAPQSAYYPLTWESRANGLNVPIGFDFAALGEAARHTIEQIERTRRPALVPVPSPNISPLPIGNQKSTIDNSNAPSYWVFAPVIQGQVKPNTLYTFGNVIGFAVAALHPEVILKHIAALSGSSSELRMSLQPLPPGSKTEGTIQRGSGGWIYRHPLEAIGAQWIFKCFLPGSVTGHRSTVALIAGLIITALMTSQLLLLGTRTKKIEAEVHVRTEELRIANTRLEANLHERAHMEEEMNELAARERRKVGRDLHDSLGQKLTGAVFLSRSLLSWLQKEAQCIGHGAREIENAEPLPGTESPPPATCHPPLATQTIHALTLNETLKSAVAQVRKMARGLAPVSLNDENLCEALEQLAEEMTGLYGVSCEVAECTEPAALDRKTKEQLYLIAREAVNNAARHAQAGHVALRLTAKDSGWKLCVEDDGTGLPEKQPAGEGTCPATGGMGIRIMRHRAGLIGAALSITSFANQGTCVDITSNT